MTRQRHSDFSRPGLGWFLVFDGGIAAMAALTASDELDAKVRERVPLPSRETIKALLVGTTLVHVVESVAAHRMARRRGLPAGPWVVQTLVVGFPSLLALRRHAEARTTS